MHPKLLPPCLVLLLAGGILAQATSGPATPPHALIKTSVDSGYLDNMSHLPKVVFRHRFKFEDTAWMNLRFGEVSNLPEGTTLKLTGTKDEVFQRHDGVTLGDWSMWSAAFNGDEIVLEFVAAPNTKANRIVVDLVVRGLFVGLPGPATICGFSDDRKQSTDKRAGRMWRGCTGWLAGKVANGTLDLMITAGHCTTSSTRILELNVPNSTSSGTLVRAHPNDQYPYSELSRLSGGIGSDWLVATVGKNSNTGKTPTQANGGVWFKLGSVPSSTTGQNITITGYGTSSVRTLTQVQKTHTGPLSRIAATSLCYSTDTTGGNSGSPVIHANTGAAIGIHTHGGCRSSGGCNSGTRIDRSDLQAAINAAGKTPGLFSVFGTGCKGTGQASSTCAANNGSGGTLSRRTAGNEYAYLATTTSALKVTGFAVFSSSTSNTSRTVATAIYGDSNGRPATTPLATGTMTIGSVAGFYKTTLSANIPVGRFYVAVNHSARTTYLADVTSGNAGAAYWRRGTGTFSLSSIVRRSSFRVFCQGGGGTGAVPLIGSKGLPQINASFEVTLGQGRASATAVMLSGTSNTTWSGGSLPFSLKPLGADGCDLLVDPQLTIGTTLNTKGEGGIKFTVPNLTALIGFKIFHQWYVVDPGVSTALKVAVSNGGQSTFGG